MAFPRSWPWLLAASILPSAGRAHPAWDGVGSLVRVAVEVSGAPAPLYAARDGSGRYYLEAREGCAYSVRLENRTGERLGVVLSVDGLNVVSGEQDRGPGRMYVLDPWGEASVAGWRTSLDEIRRFTFVNERASYAARSGKANARMGWIEVAVYRERRPWTIWPWRDRVSPERRERAGDEGRESPAERAAPTPAPETPRDADAAGTLSPEQADRLRGLGYGEPGPAEVAPRKSYPGTGWGPSAVDRVEVVRFEPERRPAERVTLRYEYYDALVALGIVPRPWHARDRLMERERGRGFAKPPRW
jgi:hypothetical protein